MRAVEVCWNKRLRLGLAVAALQAFGACEPDLNVGEWRCASTDRDATMSDENAPIAAPWSTGFEDQFCDYTEVGGFCYAEPQASYTTVTSPVHSGRFAAAFKVSAGDADGYQTRCVRQGVLPTAAYYGVWYFVPERAKNTALWNLIHFQGGDSSADQHNLWDVSLVNGSDGELAVVVFDAVNQVTRRPVKPTPIPIGEWFQLELYLERAADATGKVALYQDGELLLEAANLVTDDSSWGQWYIGNLATKLAPSGSTLYVDDVTIRVAR
jgi:hypothetical protein